MTAALKTLLYLSLCGTALGCVVALLQRVVGRRLPSRFYYFAWLVVLARFALPVPGLVNTQTASAPAQAVVAAEPQQRVAALPSAGVMISESQTAAPAAAAAQADDDTIDAASAQSQTTDIPAQTQTAEGSRAAFSIPTWVWSALWALGAAGSAAWYIIGYGRFVRRLRRTLLPPSAADEAIYRTLGTLRPSLYRSAAVSTPMLVGVFRPMIVLPDTDYEPETLEIVLSHELTHHRRGDIGIKWLSVAVYCLHWFNPFMLLLRRRLEKCCELSCDERMLRGMDKSRRQAYGHALLAMASNASLSAAVVSTTFAAEKRTLKERLEQIMKYKTRKTLVILLALAASVLLCACAVAIGPNGEQGNVTITVDTTVPETESGTLPPQSSGELASDEANGEVVAMAIITGQQESVEVEKPMGGEIVTVSTVDELLAAIAPNNEVQLKPGVYELDKAADYGQERIGGYYTWVAKNDGYELVISDIEGFALCCEGEENTAEIRTLPRYADVLAFENCEDIFLADLVIGHTEDAGGCEGSVVSFFNTNEVYIARCGLYGCGTVGIEAENCYDIKTQETAICECSLSAVTLDNCAWIRLYNCELYDCGTENSLCPLISAASCYDVSIYNCELYNNHVSQLLSASYADWVRLQGCTVYGNELGTSVFGMTDADICVDRTSFEDVENVDWYAGVSRFGSISSIATGSLYNIEGEALTGDALLAMKRGHVEVADMAAAPTLPALDIETGADGRHYVTVSTVDEFLAAIAPNTTIRLAAGKYNLADAEYYGVPVSKYYGWQSEYDGPELVISGVEGLTIEGAGAEITTLLAEPRAAEIVCFYNCTDLTVCGLTAGHIEAVGSCGAGVLGFESCERVEVAGCGLFGCGTRGVTATNCIDLIVRDTEIYDCSINAADIVSCENVAFEACDIHDCNTNEISVRESTNVTLDGEALA